MKKPSEKLFHFAGGIGFAENTSANLARNRAASIFSGADKTDSSVMYTVIVGINVYPSSRNFKLFFGSGRPIGCPARRSLAI